MTPKERDRHREAEIERHADRIVEWGSKPNPFVRTKSVLDQPKISRADARKDAERLVRRELGPSRQDVKEAIAFLRSIPPAVISASLGQSSESAALAESEAGRASDEASRMEGRRGYGSAVARSVDTRRWAEMSNDAAEALAKRPRTRAELYAYAEALYFIVGMDFSWIPLDPNLPLPPKTDYEELLRQVLGESNVRRRENSRRAKLISKNPQKEKLYRARGNLTKVKRSLDELELQIPKLTELIGTEADMGGRVRDELERAKARRCDLEKRRAAWEAQIRELEAAS